MKISDTLRNFLLGWFKHPGMTKALIMEFESRPTIDEVQSMIEKAKSEIMDDIFSEPATIAGNNAPEKQ